MCTVLPWSDCPTPHHRTSGIALLRFLLLVMLLVSSAAQAGLLERALMPGAVIQGHQQYEAECERCHSSFDKEQQPKLCLDCHEDVAADIDARKGFHGHQSSSRCQDCHTEHLGVDASIVQLDEDRFDHTQTDFALTGKHVGAECRGCHAVDKKFREASTGCVSCHQKDDRHETRLGRDCGECHGTDDWQRVADFDHSRTEFKLLGAHGKVECKLCHVESPVTKRLTHDCLSCHRQDDPHRGAMGEDCAECHVESDWKSARFDHSKTGFMLLGKHRDSECNACHKVKGEYRGAPTSCVGCHRQDDRHKGTLGDSCQSCHDSARWKPAPKFDHARTLFPLIGGHVKAACSGCHADAEHFRDTGKTCVSCHRKDDSHKGRNGELCGDCHDAKDWKTSLFDHDRATEFALRGAHRQAKCEACHVEAVDQVKPGSQCIDCHLADDVHQTRLGRQCADCHQEQDWKQSSYNHDLGQFPLIGGHRQAKCLDCHQTQLFADTDSACVACHRQKDAHEGRYGSDCGRCHNARDWQIWDFDHRTTAFALTGAHLRTKCAACHTATAAQPLTQRCAGCHAQDDIHEGGFGRDCARCHNTTSFIEVTSRVSGNSP